MMSSIALRISRLYAIFGCVWIVLSSLAVWFSLGRPSNGVGFAEMGKGLIFILVSAALLFVLLRRWEAELSRRAAALVRANRDLTQLNNRLTGIMWGTSDLIAAWDSQERYIAFNPQYARMCHAALGCEPALGLTVRQMLGERSLEYRYFSRRWRRARAGATVTVQHHQEIDGEQRWFEINYAILRGAEGEEVGGFQILHDVTERVLADKARHLHEQELHMAVDTLTEVNTELERFAYIASHDLQEPLRTVASFAQLLDRQYRPQLDTNASEYLDFIVGGAMRMHHLIQDLLAFSRVTSRGEQLGVVSSAAAFKAALENLREAIAESAADISAGDLPDLIGDSVQLMQLFQNLIGNAIKFHPPGVAPRIVVTAECQGMQWVFSVADNGIGFDPGEQDVFELFRRLHPQAAYSGTGVGLAICKRIVQRHGGEIWVESSPGHGSRFSFSLPIIPSAAITGTPDAGTLAAANDGPPPCAAMAPTRRAGRSRELEVRSDLRRKQREVNEPRAPADIP
jgi:PAS domain S-box-containing protein